MRWWWFGMMICVIIGLGWWWRQPISTQLRSISPIPQPTLVPTPSDVTVVGTQAASSPIEADKLYALVNAHRRENKLSPLAAHISLEASAHRKLQDMIDRGYWRHLDTRDTPSWYFFTESGYNYRLAGENLAFGATSAWQVFNDWVNSPRHNAELLNPAYQDMGLGIDCVSFIENNQAKCVVVLHLGAPSS